MIVNKSMIEVVSPRNLINLLLISLKVEATQLEVEMGTMLQDFVRYILYKKTTNRVLRKILLPELQGVP